MFYSPLFDDGLLFVVNQRRPAATDYIVDSIDDDDEFLAPTWLRQEIATRSLHTTPGPKYGKWNTCIV